MELFDYLEKLYKERDCENSLEYFIENWLDENFICNDSAYEEMIDGEFIREHWRSCEVDVDKRTIKLFIND